MFKVKYYMMNRETKDAIWFCDSEKKYLTRKAATKALKIWENECYKNACSIGELSWKLEQVTLNRVNYIMLVCPITKWNESLPNDKQKAVFGLVTRC